jgi:molybdopterin-biosynthesis enzyme MoeA-like protein
MILAPEDCSILTQQPNTGPGVIRINNIFVCPGVPYLLQKSIDVILPYLKSATPIQQKNIYLNCDEITIVETLNQHAQRFPEVEIGSYILSSSQTPALELSFCSYDRDQLESCIQSFVDELPTGISFS